MFDLLLYCSVYLCRYLCSELCTCSARYSTERGTGGGQTQKFKFHEWYAKMRGAGQAARLAALPHQQQWAEVMGWLDGGGDWTEEERGVMLSAVLDFVDGVERISP